MEYLKVAQGVLELEAKSLLLASEKLTAEVVEKVAKLYDYLLSVEGNLIFCGVGKSGIIAKKLASTFSSLGLSSFFLHPVEALHGDLGRVKQQDALVLISKSGTTEEIVKLLPFLPIKKENMIALVGSVNSKIASHCDIVLDCSVEKEACINNQAPTTSSTLALAMGDALAVVYEKIVGLSKEGFAENHPGGLLGKTLKMKVKDLMVVKEDSPHLHKEDTLQDVVLLMTQKPVGACAILDSTGKLEGIIVEGDIRRTFTKENNGLSTKVSEIMTENPVVIKGDDLACNALSMMEKRKREISHLPVVDDENNFLGIIRIHDLLKEGFLINS